MSGEGSHKHDIALTKQHHNYYSEQADPELARMLAADRKKASGEPSPRNDSNSDSEGVDLTVTVTEVRKTGIEARSILPTIPEKNIEIVNEESIGTSNEESVSEESVKEMISEVAQTPSSIKTSRRKNDICSPLSTNHRGISDQSTCSQSVRTHDFSVENVPYERLEDNRTKSIPKHPSLRVFLWNIGRSYV